MPRDQNTKELPVPVWAKGWKQLHRLNFVIWTVRSRDCWSQLQSNLSALSLPLHALFLIRRKRNYTVDFSAVDRELQRQRLGRAESGNAETLSIFETVKMNTRDLAGYVSYSGRIPVLLGRATRVVLVRVEGKPPGL